MRSLTAFLKGQNTHLAWWLGVSGISLFLFVELGGKSAAEEWVSLHLDGFAWVIDAALEGIAVVALYCWFPALIALAFGRPPVIPQIRGFFIAKDIE